MQTLSVPFMSFEASFEAAKKAKLNFKMIQHGTTREMFFSKNILKEQPLGGSGGGYHLSRMIMSEVDKRVKSGLYIPKNKNNDRNECNQIYFHPENIKLRLNEPIVAIDIEYCYWNTAYLIGAISKEFYEYGLSGGRKWKIGRNAAIGSLGSKYHEDVYYDGEYKYSKDFRRPYNTVRLDIIDHVWDLALKIGDSLGDGILMFLTDAFYVPFTKASDVKNMLTELGYNFHTENSQFNHIISTPFGHSTTIYEVSWNKKDEIGKWFKFSLKDRFVNSASYLKTPMKGIKYEPKPITNGNTD